MSTPSPETTQVMSSGLDLLNKKMKEIDAKQKAIFTAEQQLKTKQLLLSDPGYKKLLAEKLGLTKDLTTTNFESQLPVTPGITNPLDVGRAALGQQSDYASFIKNASTLADTTQTGIGSILKSLGDQRQADFDNANKQLDHLIELHRLGQADDKQALEMKKLTQDIQNNGFDRGKRADLVANLVKENYTPEDAAAIADKISNGSSGIIDNATGLGYQFGQPTFYGTKHTGLDIMGNANSNVHAPATMTIDSVDVRPDGGLQIHAHDDQGNQIRMMHLGSSMVKPGQQIQAGDVIATVGTPGQYSKTELSTGPHVHFDIQNSQGQFIDPNQYIAGTAQGATGSDIEARRQANIQRKAQTETNIAAQKESALNKVKIAPRLAAIEAAIPGLEATSKLVNTESNTFSQLNRYGVAALQGTNSNIAKLKTYTALRSSLARLTGEVGNLSEGEQKAVEDAFIPKWSDSKKVAEQKVLAIKAFVQVLKSSPDPTGAAASVLTNPQEFVDKAGNVPVVTEVLPQ